MSRKQHLAKPDRNPDLVLRKKHTVEYCFWFEEMVQYNTYTECVYPFIVINDKAFYKEGAHHPDRLLISYTGRYEFEELDNWQLIVSAYQEWLATKLLEEALEL